MKVKAIFMPMVLFVCLVKSAKSQDGRMIDYKHFTQYKKSYKIDSLQKNYATENFILLFNGKEAACRSVSRYLLDSIKITTSYQGLNQRDRVAMVIEYPSKNDELMQTNLERKEVIAMGQIIKGKVVNIKNTVGIPYASIGVLGTNFGTTCDSLGYFLLDLNKTDSIFKKSQSITVTSIGYDTLSISPNASLDIIRLKPRQITLETVNIKATKRNIKERILGNNREKGRVWVTFNPTKRTLSQNMGTAIGSVFNVPADKIASLVSFKCFAYPTGFNMVKYRVLAIDVATKKNLLNDELFYTWKVGNPKNIEIDFNSAPIKVKNDFILALEFVDYEINKSSERQDIMLPANISFNSKALRKLGSQNQWQAMKSINVSFQATIAY